MLADAKNADLYAEWLDYIDSPEARAAFLYIVGIAACSNRFTCHPQWKGYLRDFRFMEPGDEQPHSFITNQQWLLFYFRSPAVRTSEHSRERLLQDFESFVENPTGEWTVKLRSIADVDRLARHIRWTVVAGATPVRDA